MRSYTVAEVSAYIARRMEADAQLRDLWIRGEASNCSRPASGHWYWTLKDSSAQLACVMWRSQAQMQQVLPKDGQHLSCHGEVKTFIGKSQYQLVVDYLEPVGLGELYLELERRKTRLAAEGLFDASLKRPLPAYPARIGVVTSVEGSVLADIRTTLARRWPLVQVVVAHTPVQGGISAPEIADALRRVARAGVDLVVLARGGGSLEDLWAFNEEAVVRAIRSSPVPVVSGVGHETDTTLADLAADVRAATPTAAAELVVPDRHQVRLAVDNIRTTADRASARRLVLARTAYDRATARLEQSSPQAQIARQRISLTGTTARLAPAAARNLRDWRRQVAGLSDRLGVLGPESTFARGYAHVVLESGGVTVVDPEQAPPGTRVVVRVARGRFAARSEA